MRRALRWLFGVFLLGLLALLGADYLVWRWAGGMIGESYAGWRAARRAEGWVIESGAARLTGWPFAARLVVPDFVLKGGAAMPGGVSFSLPELDLTVAVTAPNDLLITPIGTARATLGLLPPLAITAESAALHTSLTASDAASPLAGELRRVTLRPDQTPKDAASELVLTIDRVDFLLSTPAAPPSLTLHFQAGGIDLPTAFPWPFGAHIGRAALDVGLTPLPAVTADADFVATEAAWHAAHGSLRLAATLTDWGGAMMSGEAKLDLDDKLAPQGVGLAHLIDPDAAVASLARQGLIADSSAQALGAVLRLLAHPVAEGGPAQDSAAGDSPAGDNPAGGMAAGAGKAEVDLPLSYVGGLVSAAGIPLFHLSRAGLSAP